MKQKQNLPSEILNTLLVMTMGKPLCGRLKFNVDKSEYEKVKPPFLLLANHLSTEDYRIVPALMYPQAVNMVADYDYCVGHSAIVGLLGVIPRRQFNPEADTVKRIFNVIKAGGVAAIFPEGKPSVDGTASIVGPSVARLIQHLRVPVVMLELTGTYLDKPIFSKSARGGRCKARLYNLISQDQANTLTVNEIFDIVNDAFIYDEYEYQRLNRLELNGKQLVVGLQNILYQCPDCRSEFEMTAAKDTLRCNACGKERTMGRYGVFVADRGAVPCDNVPKWYHFQRRFVAKQLEKGEYRLEGKCKLSVLPDSKAFRSAGEGSFVHDGEKLVYTGSMDGKTVRLTFYNREYYTVKYIPGESVDFATGNNTYRFIPEKGMQTAKICLAIEEAYKLLNRSDDSGDSDVEQTVIRDDLTVK